MTVMKKLTPEQRAMKNAMNLRVLKLYRHKRMLVQQMTEIDSRIDHMEKQISNIGGYGVDVEETLRDINLPILPNKPENEDSQA